MLFLIVLSVVLLAVVAFTLQNAQAVTVRFLYWELQSTLAIVTVGATTAGVMIAALVGSAHRLWKWKRRRPASAANLPTTIPAPATPATNDRTRGWTKVQ
jgi:uncharacterized integral membrane protein